MTDQGRVVLCAAERCMFNKVGSNLVPGYENYKVWLKGLRDVELNAELNKVTKNRNATRDARAVNAWNLMVQAVMQEQKRRDS